MRDLANGLRDLARALSFLQKHPGLLPWVIAPALVTLLLLIAAVWAIVSLADPLVARISSWLPGWLEGWGSGLLWILVVAALAVGGLIVFVSVVGIVAGPFNELLSEAVERRLTGGRGERFSLLRFLRDTLRGLAHGVRRLVVSLVGFALVFAVGLVPVIGTIVAVALGAWLAARAAAYDSYDAVLSRRGMSYADKLAYLRTHRGRSLGLGVAVAALLVVPVANLIALGLGAIGATLASHELDTALAREGERRQR